MRFPHAEDEEGDAQAASDAPNQMLILQDLRRDAGSGDVGGSFRTITEAGGAGIVGGKEPAVKGCGCMTTATCLKLVKGVILSSKYQVAAILCSPCRSAGKGVFVLSHAISVWCRGNWLFTTVPTRTCEWYTIVTV